MIYTMCKGSLGCRLVLRPGIVNIKETGRPVYNVLIAVA